MAKGTEWILHLQRPTQGLLYHYTHQLYLSITLPKMTYTAGIWFTPIHHSDNGSHHLSKKAFGSVGFANKLAKVKHIVALHITGALCSTATDLLNAHADLLPIRLTLDKQSFNSTLQLLSLPPDHPLHPHIHKASCRIKRFKSPLHNLLQTHNLKSGKIETIHPSHLHPSWMPSFDMLISKNKVLNDLGRTNESRVE